MAKHKYIETPDAMWQLFTAYVEDLKQNPILVHDFVGKDGDSVERKKDRPLTMEGFRCFGYDNDVTLSNYFENRDGSYDEYYAICSRIKDCIRRNQIEGGMVGIFNPSITQRLNGLKEQTENVNTNNNISLLNVDPIDKPMD